MKRHRRSWTRCCNGRNGTSTATPTPRSAARRDAFVVALAAAAGALDAIAYLRFHVFVANMTGNTVLLGLALGGGRFGNVVLSAAAIASFFFAAFITGALGAEARDDDPWTAPMIVSLIIEAVLLCVLAAGWPRFDARSAAPVVVGAAALGIQSAVTYNLQGGVSTTYMSGNLVRSGALLAQSLRGAPQKRQRLRGKADINALAWIVYLAAAVGVGALVLHAPALLAYVLWSTAAVVVATAAFGRQ